MFATRLAQWLGLPVPRVEVIEVSDWLVSHSPELRVELGGAATPCSSGRQLGSQYPDPELPMFDYLPESLLHHVINIGDFARMLVLDKWVGNADGRQAVFTRKRRGRRYHAMLCCDFSYVVSGSNTRSGSGPHAFQRPHKSVGLYVFEEGHEPSRISYESCFPISHFAFLECSGFHFQVDLGVDLRGVQ